MLQIIKIGDPQQEILGKTLELVDVKEIPELFSSGGLIQQMVQIVEHHKALGLAANQVGVSKSIIIVRETNGALMVLLNPWILKYSPQFFTSTEQCISCPGGTFSVKRAKSIEFKSMGADGKYTRMKVRGPLSVVLQHEIDHVHGKLICDTQPERE